MKKRALLSAIAMLVISAIVLTSATFAWFSMGTTVSATDITVNVSEADGLLISADNTNFSTSITFAQIKAQNEGLGETKLNPVSSNNGTAFVGGLLNESGEYEGNTNVSGQYYSFPVYIKYLGSTEGVKVDLTGTTAADSAKNAHKCIRIMAGNTGIFAPNSETSETFTYRDSSYVQQSATNVVTSASAESLQVTLTPGSVTTVNVVIWIEGDDAQCTDSTAAGGVVDVDLQFTRVA